MNEKRTEKESLYYWLVRIFAAFIRAMPLGMALWTGRRVGSAGYYLDKKHRALAYSNLKVAFAREKKPAEIRRIVKRLFKSYGQNMIELLRLPLITPEKVREHVRIEGEEHLQAALDERKGVIMLAMHFGSWELASFSCSTLGAVYKVMVKPQTRYSRLDELLNSYREAGGSVVLERGMGTREVIKSLKNNEIIGMVVDQGGKDGMLVDFFGRQASLSVGAVRMGLKLETPICFSIIIREGRRHRLVIHPPFHLVKTGDAESDVRCNLQSVVRIMEDYIRRYPWEYMWFYKIWKYSKEANIVVLDDGRKGHLNQALCMSQKIEEALRERGINSCTMTEEVVFKNRFSSLMITLISFLSHPSFCQGRLRLLKWFLKRECFLRLVKVKADYVISCGSTAAGVNFLLSRDHAAKSVSILRPGILGLRRFDAVVLPVHEKVAARRSAKTRIVRTHGAPNLVTKDAMSRAADGLKDRFENLRFGRTTKIGILIGGDTKKKAIMNSKIRLLLRQIKEVSERVDADILLTTSRRTPAPLEAFVKREFKGFSRCQLMIIPSEDDVPHAVNGILGLADILVVTGDSISMVSEAASSGRNTIVLPLEDRSPGSASRRHAVFLEHLSRQGYILLGEEKHLLTNIIEMVKKKIRTKQLDDNAVLLDAARHII